MENLEIDYSKAELTVASPDKVESQSCSILSTTSPPWIARSKSMAQAKEELCALLELENGYKCYICRNDYSVLARLMAHMDAQHPDQDPLFCVRCRVRADSGPALKVHLIAAHSRQYIIVKCVFCFAFFSDSSRLRQHMGKTHKAWPDSVCSICGLQLPDGDQMTAHIRDDHAEAGVNCLADVCHRSMSPEELPRCRYCELAFSQTSHLVHHLILGHGSEVVPCWLCQRRFQNYRGLLNHLAKTHFSRPADVAPRQDDIIPGSAVSIQQKILRKSAEISFSCEDCRLANAEQTGGPSLKCNHGGFVCLEPGCRPIFATKLMLVRHLKQKHPAAEPVQDLRLHYRTEFSCPECQAVVTGRLKLEEHLRQHEALSKMLLKKASGGKSATSGHKRLPALMKSNNSEDSFLAWHCEVTGCQKILLNKAAWVSHQKTHLVKGLSPEDGQPPVTVRRAKLVENVEIAAGYSCSDCGLPFHRLVELIQHLAAEHPDVPALRCSFCHTDEPTTAWELKWHILKMHYLYCPFARCLFCTQLFRSKVEYSDPRENAVLFVWNSYRSLLRSTPYA
jgi:hypothetical protein